jgi:hypothetical protein
MHRKPLLILFLFCFVAFTAGSLSGIENGQARSFVGQDLHLSGAEVISYQVTEAEHALVFRDGFSMSIGANRFSSDKAVAWLQSESTEFHGRVHVRLNVRVYLQGNISVGKGRFAKTTDLEEVIIKQGEEMAVYLDLGLTLVRLSFTRERVLRRYRSVRSLSSNLRRWFLSGRKKSLSLRSL